MTSEENQTRSRHALAFQSKRTKEEYARAKENVAWLSAPNPLWGDGKPVSQDDISRLLRLNQNKVAFIEKHHPLDPDVKDTK